MAREFVQPDELRNGNFVEKAGTYHLMVTDYVEDPALKNGNIIEGGFEVTCEVCAGTESSEVGKTFKATFYPPSENNKDGGKFALAKMTKFYLATNKGKHEPGKKAVLQYDTVVGRQFLATVQLRDEKYADIAGDKMWHVDDIAAPDCPKSEQFLAGMDSELRMVATAGTGSGDSASLDDL